MNKIRPLMRREWLQHRFGWTLATLLPLGLGLLLTLFGQIELGADEVQHMGGGLPLAVAAASITVTALLLMAVLSVSSAIIVSGLARRDHADRSVEFWLATPVSHTQALAVPLLVHLLLVPALALLAGLLGGVLVALVAVARVAGTAAWGAVPWGELLLAALSMTARLLAGLPLALLWMAPIILLVVLLNAHFRRWGWVILLAGLGLGSLLLKMVFGQPLLFDAVAGLVRNSGRAMLHFGGTNTLRVSNGGDAVDALRQAPWLAAHDLGLALRDLASPLLLGGLLVAAVCFALLVQWRQRGASAGA